MFFSVLYLASIFNGIHSFENYNRSVFERSCPGFGTEWVLFPDGDEIPRVTYIKANPVHQEMKIFDGPVVSEHVNFILYTRKSKNGTEIKIDEASLSNSTFDKNKEVKFVTHGFRSSGKSDTCQTIKNAFLEKYDANVFVVNWEELAGMNYVQAATFPQEVGVYTGKFLSFLVDNGADPKKTHVVGHSLGAHLSGFIGKYMADNARKIARVTGLDPAFPGFDLLTPITGGRLSKGDADFVDVIHTCGGALGLLDPVGDADFYPNGGTPMQPGCDLLSIIETCSHGRSWKFFAESISSDTPFLGYPCASWGDYVSKADCKGRPVPMGDPARSGASGKYYLQTSPNPPFAKGPEARFEEENEIN